MTRYPLLDVLVGIAAVALLELAAYALTWAATQ